MSEERAAEAVEHLHNAAREVIAAARAFLDVAEELLEDPDAGEAILRSVGDVARRIVPGVDGSGGGDDDAGVQHIQVD